MAIHSGILAWRIPWTEDPGGTLCSVAKSQTGLKQLSMHAFKKKKKKGAGRRGAEVGRARGKRREVSSSQSLRS